MRETFKNLIKRSRFIDSLAVILLTLIFALLFIVVIMRIGGDDMMFFIVGHISAWGAMVIVYYFQHKHSGDTK